LAAICLLLGACRRDVNANLERGDRLMALGQPKQAIVEYQTALNLESNAHAHRGLGLAYEALSAFVQARRHLRAALEAKPRDADARIALARVSTRFGRYEDARNLLLTAVQHEPDNDAALLLFAIYAEETSELQHAAELLTQRIDRRERQGQTISHDTRLVLADLMERRGRRDVAASLRENVRHVAIGNTRLTLELARASADRQRHALARQLLLPLVEMHPNESDAWQILALSSLQLGQLRDARDAMQHLSTRATEPEVRLLHARLGLANGLETEPTRELEALLADLPADAQHERARVRRTLADALIAQRRYDDAERQLLALLEEYPEDTDAGVLLGELRLDQGKNEQALSSLSTLAEQNAELGRPHLALGRAHLALGEIGRAELSFARALTLAPRERGARYWLALTLRRQGELERARSLLQENLQLFAADAASLTALAELLEQSAGVAAARAAVAAHGQRNPDSAEVAWAEASWYMAHHDAERALAAYRRALVIDPSFYPAVAALARFYTAHAKADLASSVIDGALAHDASDLRLFLLAARIAKDIGRRQQAEGYCERALELNPGHPLALAELAELQAEAFRDLPRAQELATQAYARAPSRPEVLDALGWVTHLAGDSARALPYLERAAQQQPDESRVIYHLGATLLALGRTEAANEKLTRVLVLEPSFPTASEIRFLLATSARAQRTPPLTRRSPARRESSQHKPSKDRGDVGSSSVRE
jgi:tetratricopeptide (TPR) repeat protein